MENKKNYVDGIDVSACEHYRAEIETKMPYGEYEIQKDKCHYSGIEIIQDCKGNKSCIYKQLQRAKAKLKKYEDIEQECEKYRLLYENADKSLVYWEEKCRRLETENERLKFQLDNAPLGVLDTYKQALQEIREIADIIANTNCNYVIEAGNIIKKINSVIGAE